jgi:two-component system nitrate/nitrite response regulator NarL
MLPDFPKSASILQVDDPFGASGMRILVADDHPLYREAVVRQISKMFPEASVVEAETLREAAAIAQTPMQMPSLFILDFYMPGMSIESIADVSRNFSDVPILILSGWLSASTIQSIIQAGARGFLPKTSTPEQFSYTVQLLLAGGTSVPAELLTEDSKSDQHGWLPSLTPREIEVLRATARGISNKEIARELKLAEVTIKLHLSTIFRKMGVRSRTEAAMLASKAGLV